MRTAEDYHALARECLQMADETSDPEAYEAYLDLAQQWTHAALIAAGGSNTQPTPIGAAMGRQAAVSPSPPPLPLAGKS